MSYTFVGSDKNGSSGSTASINVTGISEQSGDLVIATIGLNNADRTASLPSDTGGTWSNFQSGNLDSNFSGSYAIHWKIANGTEPDSYSWTLSGSGRWSVIVNVFRPSNANISIDVGTPTQADSAGANETSGTVGGITVANDSVAFVVNFTDNNSSSSLVTGFDNSYIGLTSQASQNQATAYRLFSTGAATGDVTATLGAADWWELYHFSFKDASSASVADVNFHGTNRGILRGVNRGIG